MPADRRPGEAPPVAVLLGPTASGKSELALHLAERLDAEIVTADSRQVYRGMDVGTAKPTPADRARVRHHLLDMIDPDQPFSVADWMRAARVSMREIASRGRLPLLVGGTGLYLSALIDGYRLDLPPAPDIRRRLYADMEIDGIAALAARLTAVDPALAGRTDLRNPRRVVRALERSDAAAAAGERGRALPAAEPYPGRHVLIGLDRPRGVLAERIAERAMAQFAGGLLDETRRLLDAGYGTDLPSMSGIGYREAARHLAGEWSLDEAVSATVRRTRQYARRQMTWFRRDARITWLEAGDGSAAKRTDRAVDLVAPLLV